MSVHPETGGHFVGGAVVGPFESYNPDAALAAAEGDGHQVEDHHSAEVHAGHDPDTDAPGLVEQPGVVAEATTVSIPETAAETAGTDAAAPDGEPAAVEEEPAPDQVATAEAAAATAAAAAEAFSAQLAAVTETRPAPDASIEEHNAYLSAVLELVGSESGVPSQTRAAYLREVSAADHARDAAVYLQTPEAVVALAQGDLWWRKPVSLQLLGREQRKASPPLRLADGSGRAAIPKVGDRVIILPDGSRAEEPLVPYDSFRSDYGDVFDGNEDSYRRRGVVRAAQLPDGSWGTASYHPDEPHTLGDKRRLYLTREAFDAEWEAVPVESGHDSDRTGADKDVEKAAAAAALADVELEAADLAEPGTAQAAAGEPAEQNVPAAAAEAPAWRRRAAAVVALGPAALKWIRHREHTHRRNRQVAAGLIAGTAVLALIGVASASNKAEGPVQGPTPTLSPVGPLLPATARPNLELVNSVHVSQFDRGQAERTAEQATGPTVTTAGHEDAWGAFAAVYGNERTNWALDYAKDAFLRDGGSIGTWGDTSSDRWGYVYATINGHTTYDPTEITRMLAKYAPPKGA